MRVKDALVRRVLVDGETSRRLAKDYHRSVETVRRRCRNACRRLVTASQLPRLPPRDTPLVLIADGLRFCFRNKPWVSYDMAVKPVGMRTAFFLEPVMLAGRECAQNWLCAMALIPPAVSARIRALVADGFSGCKMVARRHRWVLQRCHRHLDSKLLGKLGHRRTVRGEAIREAALAAISEVRSTRDAARIAALQQTLAEHARHPDIVGRIPGIVRRFLHDIALYRAYLDHSDLELPTTTNAIESRHDQLREILSCVNNPTAAALRIKAYTRLHPTITCNSHENPQN